MCSRIWLGWTLAIALGSSAAAGEADLFGRDTVQGVLDLRVGAATGTRSWVSGGFGKTVFSGAGDGLALRSQIAALDVVWTPRLSDAINLVVDTLAQPHVHHGVDLAEAYALYRPLPTSALRVQARAGLLYVPISMEHDSAVGEPWTVTNTITPSAINSWVGEELKVLAVEGRVSYPVGDARLGATVAMFGQNDTSGTLLSLRGWAFDDVVATAGARYALPPMNRFIRRPQAPDTVPVTELDRRAGWYGRLDAELAGGARLNAEWYDNNGDRRAVRKRQWSWNTTFLNVGASLPVDSVTIISGQLMSGRTQMGFSRGASYWFDVYFHSAYLAVTRQFGAETATLRLDAFRTRNRPLPITEDYSENGDAALLAWKHPVRPGQDLIVEGLTTRWRRPSVRQFQLDPHQRETTLQVAYRISL